MEPESPASATPESRSSPSDANGARGVRARVLVDRIAQGLRALGSDLLAYSVWCALALGVVATTFVRAMHEQTGGEWSAPLDDVFIHFDYARSTARGYPFQWSEGNGYSSGNTSLSYPFVLALGYWVGFRGELLMPFAIGVAVASLLVFFLAIRTLFEPLGRWAKYLAPVSVLSLGALDWSLFSGMENAFHLGMWGLALVALARHRASPGVGRVSLLGVTLALLVWTRPESVVCVAAFSVAAAIQARPRGWKRSALALVLAGAPAAAALAAQSVANRVFTGEWSQAGALAKLAIHGPYLTREAKLDDWLFHLRYVIDRMNEHHFASGRPWGYLVAAAALVPFASRRTRAFAAFLWVQVVGWTMVVALNGQVRWQNERYAMSAVAWLLVLAALGLALLVSRPGRSLRARVAWGGRVTLAVAAMVLYWQHQRPNFRDQVWFYARASRNIRDQHIVAGKVLRSLGPKRILVGDAGALLYASDLPGLDLIGLGGYHDLPFARATRHGIGGALELIERIEPSERPDVMAIYPTWWGDLPIVFGHYLTEFPVVGNVICGGASKVLYRADWSPLDRDGRPRLELRAGERVVDEMDVGDLVGEREHGYVRSLPEGGFLVWRVLPEPGKKSLDLFDAGRIVPPKTTERFKLSLPTSGGRLVARSAPSQPVQVEARVGGRLVGVLAFAPTGGWVEASLPLPDGLPASADVELTPVDGEWTNFHVWTLGAS